MPLIVSGTCSVSSCPPDEGGLGEWDGGGK